MKNRTDLNLGDVFFLSIIYHIPNSWLNLLNGYDFYFEALLGVFGIRDIREKNYRDTGYLRKNL